MGEEKTAIENIAASLSSLSKASRIHSLAIKAINARIDAVSRGEQAEDPTMAIFMLFCLGSLNFAGLVILVLVHVFG